MSVADAVMITLLLVLAVAAASIAMLAFAARRRYRKARARLVTAFLPGGGGSSALASSIRALPAIQAGWWSVQRERRHLWRSVEAAEHAVKTATHANAPVGDLPQLTQRLRRAADTVDSALLAGSRAHTRIPDAVHVQRLELQARADDICRAALNSLATTAHAPTHEVSQAVQVEVHALADGLRSAYRGTSVGR